jgi:fido (protein-threonine AMPylation protein)
MSKDPYVYDDTNILKNLANIKEQHKLDDYETTMVNLGIIKLLKSDIEIVKVNDIFLIHKKDIISVTAQEFINFIKNKYN